MPGEITTWIWLIGEGIGEARTVGDVGGSVGAPRESQVGPDVEGVALVVIERTEIQCREIGQAARNSAPALDDFCLLYTSDAADE